MKQLIHQIINNKHKSTNGSCGTYLKDVCDILNISFQELEVIICEMYNNEEINIRDGIHGFMLFKI